MIYSLVGFLCVLIVILCIKIYLLKKSAREIEQQFADRLKTDTNTLIDIASRDRDMCRLAGSVNRQLKVLREKDHRYTQGDMELKTAITNISHDLRTPLTTVRGYLDVMKHMEKPQKIEKYLDIIDERTKLMQKLTEELFCYSVIISEEREEKTEEVFVNQVLEESIGGYYAMLEKKGITPQIHITAQRIVRNLDKTSLSRVFSNLLNNALKYSDGDLKIMLSDHGEIVFANTAKALSAVSVKRLFDRFYTVETARDSTGLGLYIARTLVERMGGEITAEYKDQILYIRLIFK